MKKFVYLFAILTLVLALAPFSTSAQEDPAATRPAAASPDLELGDAGDAVESTVLQSESLSTLSSEDGCTSVFQAGGDRLAEKQKDDGGWDWPLDNGDPTASSPPNTIAPIAMGLAQAYFHTDDGDHLAALEKAGSFLLSKTNNFSPSDGYLAAQLDVIFGGTTYVDHVMTNYYDPLAAGTYDRNGAGTLYDTAMYVASIDTTRASQGIPNLAAWDIGMGLVGAASCGADTTAWVDGTIAEIDELDGNAYYDVIGLAGAVYGLAFVGEDYDPTTGQHAAASNLVDLANILAGYQIAGGGFTWNMNYLNASEYNETIQETAYAVLALNQVDRTTFWSNIQGAADYMRSVQLSTGGWKNWDGGGENNEITGEALWGISVGSPGPATSNVLSLPNPAPVGGEVLATGIVAGCAMITSAAYTLNGQDWYPMDAEDGDFGGFGENVVATLNAPGEAGIYDLCVRGTDAVGNTGPAECIMLVVYDPDGGFVTGGGWIESPPGAYKLDDFNAPTFVWDQGFEIDDGGWFDVDDEWYGTVTRVPSGFGGIASSAGAYHAIFEGDADSGPFSRFDGYRDTWTGSWTAEIDIYLDPAWAAGTGFDYSVAASGSDGLHQRDYIFHVTKDTSTEKLLVAGSNNTNFAPREDLESVNNYEVTVAGWYTFQHIFYDQGGGLAVDLNLLDSGGDLLFTETRFNAADLIPGEVGGNRYAWFTFINVGGGIAVDEHQLVVPIGPTGKATFGFVSKYRKGADVPTGNTEFVFNAAELNFHSTTYQWLIVTGSDYAKFKGAGLINGQLAPNEQEYRFMLWAGDGEPDTFRIKIWWEAGDTETVVYDNGMDQAIGSGSIVIHTK